MGRFRLSLQKPSIFSTLRGEFGASSGMAWDGVEFRDRHGNPVGEKTRETLLRLIEKALGTSSANPSVLINAAANVCANIGTIRNFTRTPIAQFFVLLDRGMRQNARRKLSWSYSRAGCATWKTDAGRRLLARHASR